MFYYTKINENNMVLNVSAMTFESNDVDHIPITEALYNYFEENDTPTTQIVYDSGTEQMSAETRSEVPYTINKTNITADGIDTILISDLPIPTDVGIIGVGSYTTDDEQFEFSIDETGTYIINLFSKRYQKKEISIDAS